MEKLGQIEQVDVRSVWESESSDFTPWLAENGNLALLGNELGIELELEAQEKEVGPFRADILCKDTADASWVLIENQIERTDHKHLGQILTYAAGLEAVSIVWISTEFTEEHKTAIDWLNQITNDSVRFFGVEIEVWRIGNSPAAPKFRVVCKPNDWGNTVRRAADDLADASPAEQLRMRYWSAFKEHLQEQQSKLRPQKPAPNHWYNFSIGTSRAHLAATLITKEDKIGVELYIDGDNAKEIYTALYAKKEQIEAQLAASLDWRELPEKKVSRVLLYKPVDPTDESDWEKQFAWLRTTIEKFDGVFRPLFAHRAFG